MIDLPHIASRVFGTPLMIARAKLEVILGVLAPRLAGIPLEPIDKATDPAPQISITVERIAVVSVIGTLVARSSYIDAASGLLSYGEIGDAIATAMGDPLVRGVILDVDSPGGEVGGLFDLIDQIGAIKRGTDKPLWQAPEWVVARLLPSNPALARMKAPVQIDPNRRAWCHAAQPIE